MTDYKLEVAKIIEKVIENQNNEIKIDGLEDFIETPPNSDMGDYAFPCFRLAKSLKKAPQMIASDLKEDIDINLKDDKTTNIEKVEVAGRLLKLLYK